ncbi:MAG: 1-acyl-sn-glycerol-3-phosphate acyltransferase [Xanthomonadales bacterium]|nr:1-acyl-sn-glycerol-3-phosphate acyltransferase [Xanthomonadales bacterium]
MIGLLRTLWRLLAIIDLVLISLPLYLLSWLPWRGRHPVARLFQRWCRAMVRALGVDLRLHQHHRDPLPARYILIANHPSAFEDVGIPALFDVVSLAKWEVQHWWFVGRIARAAGTLFVRRDDADSRRAAREAMVTAVQGGVNLALYPEGGCKGRRLYHEFRSGAFDVAMRTGVPILPVFLHYEAQDVFEWRDPQTLLQKLWHIGTAVNNRANYHVFDPVDPKEFADRDAFRAAVYARYRAWDERYLG